ncbi:MAG: hypothetical protein KAU38_12650, partial [Desulfobacterales bacterium]|nr:hypothetical protein [Desulfobacterales bacterium]
MIINDFQYDEAISSSIMSLLKKREETCSSIFSKSTTFLWSKEKVADSEDKYVLIRRGLVDWAIGSFTEDEIHKLSEKEFLSKISLEKQKDILKKEKQYLINRIAEWRKRVENLFTKII